MRKVRIFRLLTNIPGGYVKGDTVNDRGTGVWVWEKDERCCVFDPLREPDFFVEIHQATFKEGDIVLLTLKGGNRHRIKNENEFTEFRVIKVKRNADHEVLYEINRHGRHSFTVNENEIMKPTFYWFINSSGTICKNVLYENDTKSNYHVRFRIATNNFFITKEEVDKRLLEIQKTISKQ